ncbi:POLK [Enterospora canceri]|uniref:DNA polymerase kappa n=1 Tax=Enterospora canceri TaxID=1081671 RepID=A0A1Y1S6L7_9MICR|nr:POLK [Enterospora canceri]
MVEGVKFTVVNSTGELFEENEEQRMFAVHEKAENLRQKYAERVEEIQAARNYVDMDMEIDKLKMAWPALFGLDDPDEFYVHVDLDSYYASVETLLNPKLKDVPLAVGSMAMIATSNYKAREYNVKAGMPGYHAKKLCPHLVIIPPQMNQYNYYSEVIMEILSCYDTQIEIYGIDESCMVFNEDKLVQAYEYHNSTNAKNDQIKYGGFNTTSISKLVEKIRQTVYNKTKLTISAGISLCRGHAKFASNINKPNGQLCIIDNFDQYILNLPCDKINGIGKMTKLRLSKTFQVTTVADLRNKHAECALVFPTKTFLNVFRLSFGFSQFDFAHSSKYNSNFKSIGNSYTIRKTTSYVETVQRLYEISQQVWQRMKKCDMYGMVVTLVIKYSTFKLVTRRKKINFVMKRHRELFETVVELLQENVVMNESKMKVVDEEIRMLGVTVSDLSKRSNLKTLEEFVVEKKAIDPRKCFLCQKLFLHESDVVFESHVNRCVDKAERDEKEAKKRIDYYIRKK